MVDLKLVGIVWKVYNPACVNPVFGYFGYATNYIPLAIEDFTNAAYECRG